MKNGESGDVAERDSGFCGFLEVSRVWETDEMGDAVRVEATQPDLGCGKLFGVCHLCDGRNEDVCEGRSIVSGLNVSVRNWAEPISVRRHNAKLLQAIQSGGSLSVLLGVVGLEARRLGPRVEGWVLDLGFLMSDRYGRQQVVRQGHNPKKHE
jgi:hypothetical protein